MASALVCCTLPKITWPMSSGRPRVGEGGLGGVHREVVADTPLSVPESVPKAVRRAERITTSRESFAMIGLLRAMCAASLGVSCVCLSSTERQRRPVPWESTASPRSARGRAKAHRVAVDPPLGAMSVSPGHTGLVKRAAICGCARVAAARGLATARPTKP
jgi:hypothetical protein